MKRFPLRCNPIVILLTSVTFVDSFTLSRRINNHLHLLTTLRSMDNSNDERDNQMDFYSFLSNKENESITESTTESHTSSTSIEYDDFLPNPNPSYTAIDVVTVCMDTLLQNKDAGLEVCFQFSNDRCRAAIGGSLTNFREYANNPVFGYLINCIDWEILSIGPIIQGTQHRGSMQTVLMTARQRETVSLIDDEENEGTETTEVNNDDRTNRRFLWTLQQERRPPLQGCWMVHEVLYTKNAFKLTE